MISYKLITDSDYIQITRNDIISTVPNDPKNTDWQEYQAWLAADPENEPDPAD